MTDLSESEFEVFADETLSKMLEALADVESEAYDVDLESGVLTVSFSEGPKYVVNSHRAARQIWMAAHTTAWHFDWNGSQWISTKTKDELWATVNKWVSERAGSDLGISAP